MQRTRTHGVLPILLVAILVLAGCGATGGGAASPTEVAQRDIAGSGDGAAIAATSTPIATPEPTPSGASATGDRRAAAERRTDRDFAVRQRALIRTGRVKLKVDDFERARRNLTRATERRGGFVSDTSQERHRVDNETYLTGAIVLRVPSENFSAVMASVQGQGTVLAASTETADVTDQLVDINARLESLRAQRDQLRALYQRANDTEAVLAVQRRLSDVQTEIERLEARKQSLERRVAFSTIRVTLAEPRPEPEPDPVEQWYEVPIVSAFLDSIDGVIVTLRASVVLAAYVLPYLGAFGVPLVAAGVFIWRRRDRDGSLGNRLRNR